MAFMFSKERVENPQECIDSLTMLKIVRSEELKELFGMFCEQELCDENFLLWKDVEEYRNIEDDRARRLRFNEMFAKYVSEESHMEANMSGSDRASLHAAKISKSAPPADVFDNLQMTVWVEMSTELLPRFARSEMVRRFYFERPDSPETIRKRGKLADFFGMDLSGPLQRAEVISVVATRGYEKNNEKRKLGHKTNKRNVLKRSKSVETISTRKYDGGSDYRMNSSQSFGYGAPSCPNSSSSSSHSTSHSPKLSSPPGMSPDITPKRKRSLTNKGSGIRKQPSTSAGVKPMKSPRGILMRKGKGGEAEAEGSGLKRHASDAGAALRK